MAFFQRPRFTRARDGGFRLRLPDDERSLLAGLPDQISALIAGDDAQATVRLFPPAYVGEPELDAEYQRLMREELVRRRLEAVSVVRDTLDSDRLTEEQLSAWMRVLNDVRLVLGTILDVTEDRDPLDVPRTAPDLPQRLAYVVLSDIVADAVDALSGALPPGAPT